MCPTGPVSQRRKSRWVRQLGAQEAVGLRDGWCRCSEGPVGLGEVAVQELAHVCGFAHAAQTCL